jgi:microcystin-dependent protein
MSCTAADLINIQPLTLSDTFSTWFDRTNEVIQAANYLNIYDIGVGATGGLFIESGCSGGYYNGFALMSVNVGAGLGIGSASFTNNTNKVVVDAFQLEDLGTGSTSNPSVGDYIIVSDISDTRQGAFGTPKRTPANRMLPPIVTFGDSGNGSFTIQGDVNIVGNLNVSDTVSYIDSNDLRIEDKVIELASARYVEFVVQGSGFTAGTFLGGQTAFYHDTTVPTLATATSIGQVRGWSLGSATTGNIQLNAFTEGGVADFALSGLVVVTGSSVLSAMVVTSQPSISTDYFNDELLTPAGIDIKGLSGDKTFLWNYRTPDTLNVWNAFMANTDLGVTGSSSAIISSRYKSFGYGAADNSFTLVGAGSSYSKFSVGTELSMEHSPAGAAGVTFGIVAIGSTGTTYPNVPVYSWVRRFNADQLDGAHASTAAAAWTIPVSLTDGRVHEDFIRADGVRKVFNTPNSGFAVGDVVRISSDGSLTFAKADTVATAEVFGMVETVHDNRISVLSEGYITGLTGARINALKPLVTGNVYYLSAAVGGGLITNPDEGAYALTVGQVRRAVLIATDGDRGYVTSYAGTVLGGGAQTDLVYLPTVAPVGTIQPYAGLTANIPQGWLLCHGAAYEQNSVPDLFEAIGHTYYAIGSVVNSTILTVDDDTRGLAVDDALRITWSTGTVDALVTAVNTATREVTINTSAFTLLPAGTALRVYGRTVASGSGRSVFFLPDLRRRTVFGTSFADGLAGSGTITPQLALAAIGGADTRSLIQENLPQHRHVLPNSFNLAAGAIAVRAGTSTTGDLLEDSTTQTGDPFDTMPPYVSMHYIIRSVKTLPAIIITGHNHDNFYIRYDIPHTVGAGAANTLDSTDREQFRANAQALSKESDDSTSGFLGVGNGLQVTGQVEVVEGGIDVQYGARVGNYITLTGPNSFTILGNNSKPQKEFDDYGVRANSYQADMYSAQIRVLSETPTIVLFSPTAASADPQNENRGRISHYGSQHPSASPGQALLTASIGFSTRGPGAIGADGFALNSAVGEHEFRIGININGRNAGNVYSEDTALLISRKDTDLKANGSIKYRLPKLLPTYNSTVANNSVLINSNGELRLGPADTVGTVAVQVWNGTFNGPDDRGTVVMPANTASSNGIFAIVSTTEIAVKGTGTWNGYISVRNTPSGDTFSTFTPFVNKTTNNVIEILQGSFTSSSVLVHAYRID